MQQKPAGTEETAQTSAYIVDWTLEMNDAPNHMKTVEKTSETHHLHLDYLNQIGTMPDIPRPYGFDILHPHIQLDPAVLNNQDLVVQAHQWDHQT